MLRKQSVFILLACVLGCSSAAHTPATARSASVSRNVLTGDEIRAANRVNALAAVEMLRPSLLRYALGSESSPAVYIDGIRGNYSLADLATIMSESILEIRYLSPSETMMFGSYHRGGAIVLTTRR